MTESHSVFTRHPNVRRRRDVRSWRLALLLALLLPAGLEAQFSGEVDYATTYLFAGVPFAAQGEGAVTRGTFGYTLADAFTVSAFGVWDYETSQISEADLLGEFSGQATRLLAYYVGGAFYNFRIDDNWETSYELYGGLTLAAPLSPTLHVAHDFDLGDGTRAFFGLSQGIPLLASGPAITLAGRVEYNDSYYTGASGFAYADLMVSLGLELGPVILTPAVTIQRQLDDAFTGFIDDEEVFSISAGFGF